MGTNSQDVKRTKTKRKQWQENQRRLRAVNVEAKSDSVVMYQTDSPKSEKVMSGFQVEQ
jgi:hypothetical protein